MQYLSSSTIFCRPRTWPSIRRRRVRYLSLSGVYPCIAASVLPTAQYDTPAGYHEASTGCPGGRAGARTASERWCGLGALGRLVGFGAALAG